MNGELRLSKTAKRKGAIAEFCVEKNRHALFMPMRIFLAPAVIAMWGSTFQTQLNWHQFLDGTFLTSFNRKVLKLIALFIVNGFIWPNHKAEIRQKSIKIIVE